MSASKPTTVLAIVKGHLDSNGFDGLFNNGECACLKDDLAPCIEPIGQCEPGYRVACTSDDCEVCDGDGWHVTSQRPRS